MSVITDHWPALGTTIEGGVRADPTAGKALWADIRSRVAAFEHRFSRFRPDSELSAVNTAAGRPTAVSLDMQSVLAAAGRMFTMTEATVDPTIGEALIASGYDRSFDQLTPTTEASSGTEHRHRSASWRDVKLDQAEQTVTLPAGVSLDFGGIGKGYLLDELVPVIEAVTKDYWLSLGGDLVVSGVNDEGQRWRIGIQHPRDHDQNLGWLTPPPGRWGIATSGTTGRHGVKGGRPWHHLIDPATGEPAVTDVLGATVVASTGLMADVLAKTVVIRGAAAGLAWLATIPHAAGLAAQVNGQVVMTEAMRPLVQLE